jgi:hypothetical protein
MLPFATSSGVCVRLDNSEEGWTFTRGTETNVCDAYDVLPALSPEELDEFIEYCGNLAGELQQSCIDYVADISAYIDSREWRLAGRSARMVAYLTDRKRLVVDTLALAEMLSVPTADRDEEAQRVPTKRRRFAIGRWRS